MKLGLRRWLAAVCLLGDLLALVHGVAVTHVACPDHGELIHTAAALPDAGPRPRATAELAVVEHDRCLCPLEEQQAPLVARVAVVPAPADAPLVSRPSAPERPFVLAPLVLAPKHGPPRATVPLA